MNLTIGYKICYAERPVVGMLIREAQLMLAFLMILDAAFVAICAGVAENDLSESSKIVNLGSGPRSIYRIGYSGGGPVDIDELIEQARISSTNSVEDEDHPTYSGQVFETALSQPTSSEKAPQSATPAEPGGADLFQDVPTEDNGLDRSEIAAIQNEDEKPPYVRVLLVSDPPSAEVYIDGIFYGVTPFIATVEPESHLVEVYLNGYWNWFNVVDFSDGTRTIPITLAPRHPLATNESEMVQDVSSSQEIQPAVDENHSGNATSPPSVGDDFWEDNYRKFLITVAILSFLIGSGSIASWARSRLTTSVKISFPRDGEDKWAGLVEGQSSRVRGTKKQVYVLFRRDDDQLQAMKRVEPNSEGRWFTRCEVEEGTVYRIYAVVVDRPLIEGAYLEEIPSHRAISEVGPVTGREKSPRPGG